MKFSEHYYKEMAKSIVRHIEFNSMTEDEMTSHLMDYFSNSTTKEICFLAIQMMLDASTERNRPVDYWHRVRINIEKL